jgi:hypothetical protein
MRMQPGRRLFPNCEPLPAPRAPHSRWLER